MRLPRLVPADVVDAARSLDSPTGRTLTDWLLTGGPADPVAEVDAVPWRSRWREKRPDTEPAQYPVVRLVGPAPTQQPVIDRMLRYDPADYDPWKLVGSQPLWPAALPSHREVVAAHLLPETTVGLGYGRTPHGSVLPALADCAGPCGPATWYLIGAALGSAHEDDRVAAVDAALTLNATGDLDGHAFGLIIGQLVNGRNTKLTRVTAALTDLAGAADGPAVWHTVAALLSAVLPNQKPPAGTPDLLALAAGIASPGTTNAPITGLAEVAARSGSSRLVTESRRLTRILSG